jgi:acyl carrier protein
MSPTEEKISHIIEESLYVKETDIHKDSKLSDFSIDSLDKVDLMMEIEDEFEINIDDEEFADLDLISDIVKFVENKLNK